MEVDVRALEPLVAKEQRDAGEVDAALVELHGCGVAENVRRNTLALERRARERGGRDVFRDQPLNRIVTEPCPLLGGENRLVRAATPLTTYLGHTEPANTYWYLSAAPELLALAGERLERRLGELP